MVSGAAQELDVQLWVFTLKAALLVLPLETAGADILEILVYFLFNAKNSLRKALITASFVRKQGRGSGSLVDIPPCLPYSAISVTEILESAPEIIHAPAVPPPCPAAAIGPNQTSPAGSQRQAPMR